MSNKTLEMHKIRQMLRLSSEGRGSKYISRICGISRNTVKKYLRLYAASGLTCVEACGLSDLKLNRLLFPAVEGRGPQSGRLFELEQMLPELSTRLKKRGVTKGMLYDLYINRCPGGYKPSRFLDILNRFLHLPKASARVVHQAGDKLFVDFTGKKLRIVDSHSGELTEVETFVSVLGCSQLTYVCAVSSQKRDDFIDACRRALEYYDGVPQAIVPDNLKAAVKRASRYEAELNAGFSAFAEHYATNIFPARAYKPKDKALVEGAIKIIYRTVFTHIDQGIYHSLEALNAAITPLVEAHNNALLSGQDYSRRMQFEQLEKHTLKTLPPFRYEPVSSRIATVAKTGYVTLDYHYYSVPYRYIGKKVTLCYSRSKVEIYQDRVLLSVHERSYAKEKYVRHPEHLASWQQYPTEWNPEKFVQQARQISEVVTDYIKSVLARSEYPEKNYRACLGILNFAKRVGNLRLSNACRHAGGVNIYNFRIIERILQSRADEIPFDDSTYNTSMPEHDNIRGEQYYQ